MRECIYIITSYKISESDTVIHFCEQWRRHTILHHKEILTNMKIYSFAVLLSLTMLFLLIPECSRCCPNVLTVKFQRKVAMRVHLSLVKNLVTIISRWRHHCQGYGVWWGLHLLNWLSVMIIPTLQWNMGSREVCIVQWNMGSREGCIVDPRWP